MATSAHTTTKISVSVLSPLFHDWSQQVDDCHLKRDAFLEHVIKTELEFVRADLAGKRNSDMAKAFINDQLRRLGGAKTLPMRKRSFKVSKSVANQLREVEEAHNLVRDSFFNRLIVLMRARPGLLRALDLPPAVPWNNNYGAEVQMGPLPNMLDVIADPMFNLRQECQRLHGCGLHQLDFPRELVGLTLYLEDMHVPGTDEHADLMEALDIDMTLLADAERFTDNLTPASQSGAKGR